MAVTFAQEALVVFAHLLADGLLVATHQGVQDALEANRPLAAAVTTFPLHLDAALAEGVSRVVYTSSIGALHRGDGPAATEDDLAPEAPADSVYRAVKWHLALPLREPWETSGSLNADRVRWKSELYPAARYAMHLVGDLVGRGFDRELAQFLCRMYVGAPRDRDHAAVPREVLGREGLGFDVAACLGALEELGVVDPADVRAARTAAQFAPGRAWDLDDGTPPMVAIFASAQ